MASRDQHGRFSKKKNKQNVSKRADTSLLHDHNYVKTNFNDDVNDSKCNDNSFTEELDLPSNCDREGWKRGRRIIELGFLLDNLKFCKVCKLGPVPLTSENVLGELRKGLGGYLYVQCMNTDCASINRVPYGKTHRQKRKGMPCFVSNTKLGTAMIDGIGGSGRVNNMLATLNIKPVHRNNLQIMERRAGAFIESVANRSTKEAAKEAFTQELRDVAEEETQQAEKCMEAFIPDLGVGLLPDTSPSVREHLETCAGEQPRDITPQASSTQGKPPLEIEKKPMKSRKSLSSLYPCKTRHGMSCAVDTAWQKRGFDSLTSHTFFMSKAKYGKKVVKSIVSHRSCATCKWWKRNRPGQPVRRHRCVHNHTGSARMMESVSGVKGVHQLASEGTPVEFIEGDGDNTMIARLKSSNIDMKKRFDKNHVIKNIGKNLYALQADKGVKISKIVISHIQKCISYAFSKNAGDKEGLEKNLRALIPHNFGDHSLCEERFCNSIRKPGVKYIHRSLPYKAALSDITLRKRLDAILEPIIRRADQYCDLGSSQQCEHANREVALRAPKSLHYGDSEALDFRVQATTAFINEGRHYIPQVNTEAGMSPGEYTLQYADRCAKKRKHSQERSQLPSTKRRRLLLKQERTTAQGAHEALEGVSYQSGIGHEEDVDIDQLPDAVPRGVFKPVSAKQDSATYVIMDLETTDLIRGGQMPHITQLAAMEIQTGSVFSKYIFPEIPIAESAERVTGIAMAGKEMIVNGRSVDALPIKQALDKFLVWLSSFSNVVLLAHNGRRFDFPVFVTACQNTHLYDKFNQTICGMADTLNMFKSVFPKMPSYKQEELARAILNVQYDAHNAVEDVRCLSKLVVHSFSKDCSCAISNSFPLKAIHYNMMSSKCRYKHMPSLNSLVANSVMKTATAENIASSGLGYAHLKKNCERSGEDGLRNIFTAKNSEGQPRVTNCKRTLETVIPNMVKFFEKN